LDITGGRDADAIDVRLGAHKRIVVRAGNKQIGSFDAA